MISTEIAEAIRKEMDLKRSNILNHSDLSSTLDTEIMTFLINILNVCAGSHDTSWNKAVD